MRATSALWQHALRLTLFTRNQCSLCTDAKGVLSNVWDRRHFNFAEIDVMEPGNEKWKVYEFDVPVVHFDRSKDRDKMFETTTEARKLMHRFTEREVERIMDEVEQE